MSPFDQRHPPAPVVDLTTLPEARRRLLPTALGLGLVSAAGMVLGLPAVAGATQTAEQDPAVASVPEATGAEAAQDAPVTAEPPAPPNSATQPADPTPAPAAAAPAPPAPAAPASTSPAPPLAPAAAATTASGAGTQPPAAAQAPPPAPAAPTQPAAATASSPATATATSHGDDDEHPCADDAPGDRGADSSGPSGSGAHDGSGGVPAAAQASPPQTAAAAASPEAPASAATPAPAIQPAEASTAAQPTATAAQPDAVHVSSTSTSSSEPDRAAAGDHASARLVRFEGRMVTAADGSNQAAADPPGQLVLLEGRLVTAPDDSVQASSAASEATGTAAEASPKLVRFAGRMVTAPPEPPSQAATSDGAAGSLTNETAAAPEDGAVAASVDQAMQTTPASDLETGATAQTSGQKILLASSTATAPAASGVDLKTWKLQLPEGAAEHPTEISQPQLESYRSDWFQRDPASGAVRFRAPVDGVTTPGSNYPRSELRETTAAGQRAAWSTTEGTHTLTIDEAITEVPKGDRPYVVAGQVHGEKDDLSVFRLEGNRLYVTDGNTPHGKLVNSDYKLGTRFQAQFKVHDGQIDAYYNGTFQTTVTPPPDEAYFKVGAYTQANCTNSKPCDASNGGTVEVYGVSVTHDPAGDRTRATDAGRAEGGTAPLST